jgi:probable F420-dependent oxidoreductase
VGAEGEAATGRQLGGSAATGIWTGEPTVSFEGEPLRLGIMIPGVVTVPQNHASWELDVTIEDMAQVAVAADRLGYSHVSCSEHVVIPAPVAPIRGGRYWDPLPTFGYLSAVTTRVQFATNVLVLGYHHPLAIAKRYGTLDQVTGGRLILGLGVGSLREEFDLLGAPFEDRGARADDALRALRASLSSRYPEYDGPYYKFSGVQLDPCARRERVPLWIGGRTGRSLRRALELGDGWIPFGLSADDMGALIAKARLTDAWAARTQPLEVILPNDRRADPLADPAGTRDIVRQLMEAGATAIQLRFAHHSLAHFVEQLEATLSVLA